MPKTRLASPSLPGESQRKQIHKGKHRINFVCSCRFSFSGPSTSRRVDGKGFANATTHLSAINERPRRRSSSDAFCIDCRSGAGEICVRRHREMAAEERAGGEVYSEINRAEMRSTMIKDYYRRKLSAFVDDGQKCICCSISQK